MIAFEVMKRAVKDRRLRGKTRRGHIGGANLKLPSVRSTQAVPTNRFDIPCSQLSTPIRNKNGIIGHLICLTPPPQQLPSKLNFLKQSPIH